MPDLSNCTIMVVDDTEANIDILLETLGDDYDVCVAMDGESALEDIANDIPDLILLDIMMPGMDGYEVCRRLKADPKTEMIPIVFVTAMGDVEDETKGLKLGAIDYLHKPINPAIVEARVKNHLELKLAKENLKNQNVNLEFKVQERTKELVLTQDMTIHSLANLAETRDPETGGHIRRTQHYVKAIAESLQHHPKYKDELDKATIEMLFKTAPLHDIGKVGVRDDILLKPGKLTEEEFEEMKKHTEFGMRALKKAKDVLGNNQFIKFALDIGYTHHEKWDGTGYPRQLKDEEIPLAGRIMAVADVYDALISKRVYKSAFSHEKAMDIIRKEKGIYFDPHIVDAFCEIEETIQKIALEFIDQDES